jgi:hypothetical protein
LSFEARIFFPELNIRLYDNNSESEYHFFPPPKSEYFFQQHWESEYWKLNGPFLKTLSEKAIIAVIVIVAKQKKI